MAVSILFANTGIFSLWSGGGVNNAGTELRLSPSSGVNSVAYYVKDGTSSPSLSTTWGNQNGSVDFKYFECRLDNMLIEPSSVTFRVHGEAFMTSNLFNVTALWLLFRKVDNPGLPQDVIIASGQYSISTFNFTSGAGAQTKSAIIPIIQANRAAFNSGIGGIPTLSGQIRDIEGFEPNNSQVIYDWQVEISGSDPPTPSSNNNITLFTYSTVPTTGNIDLYTFSLGSSTGNIDLFMNGVGGSNSGLDLYTNGYASHTGNVDLFIQGGVLNTGNINLYTYGYSSGVNNIPLYIANEPPGEISGQMNLFISTPTGTQISGITPLFIYSAENSGLYNYTTLFLNQTNVFNPLNVMNLVMPGPDALGYTSSMNLVLFQNTEVTNSLALFLQNSYINSTGAINLYMRGPVGTEGAIPFSGALNLFIARDSDSLSFSAPLFLKTPEIISGDLLSLFIDGTNIKNSSIPMYIHGQHIPNNSMNLYSHGF